MMPPKSLACILLLISVFTWPLYGASTSAEPFLKLAATFTVIDQPGAAAIRQNLVKQLEAADYLEKKLTEPTPDKRMNELTRVLAESYAQIGHHFAYVGEHALAHFFYGKSLALEKKSPKRQLDYAMQLTHQNELSQAELLFESAFKDNSPLPNASFYRTAYAQLLFQKKRV